jgi:hypothetical protein
MTLHNIEASPPGLKLVFRISLALLVMILAERAADLSHGEPEVASDSPSDALHSSTEVDEDQLDEDNPAQDAAQPNYTSPTSEGDGTSSGQRLREGTILTDVIGRFKVSGDRASFTITETGQTFGGLENLNLARVTNAIRDDPDADWSISGLVTEHRGLNFLLIHKAIRKSVNKEVHNENAPPDTVSTPLESQDSAQPTAPTGF